MRRLLHALALPALVLVASGLMREPPDRQDAEAPQLPVPEVSSELERGRALVVLANCKGCHTTRGGHAFAGNRAIPTAFGTFFSPNITPDPETGIGRWTEEDFWQALHEGRSPDGTLLYPAFPYPNYTRISRRDARAMFAYLKSLPPVRASSTSHEIDFPYNQRFLLAIWRRLYFRPGVYVADSSESAAWNRGAYLVEAVAHCGACHEARDWLGGPSPGSSPAGGMVVGWYAPTLNDSREAGLSSWSEEDIVALLKTGRTMTPALPSQRPSNHQPGASTLGPMAEVVFESLQHTAPEDLEAIAIYLKSLPELRTSSANDGSRTFGPAENAWLESGATVYKKHCASCHGENGEGSTAAIALAGNRAVTMRSTVNPIRLALYGGYPPGTTANSRPYGMPSFSHTLDDREIGQVVSFIRTAWGNDGGLVSPNDVAKERTGPLW